MPEIKQNFTVQQPAPVVWALFQDVPQVAECMPGVELLDDLGDGKFKGKMKVKLGPISAQFQGEASITEIDEAALTGTISAKGVDRQGGSRASAKVQYQLVSEGTDTKVDIQADISLQGSMAQFGRTGLIQEVSGRLTQEFADCLQGKLGATTQEEAAQVKAGDVKGFRIFFQSLWARFKRLSRSKSKNG